MCKCTPHKHAAVIKAWADGSKVQYKHEDDGTWIDAETPTWVDWLEYRIKPEPKPDVVLYGTSDWIKANGVKQQRAFDTCAFTFDGETGQLKSAEVIR